VKLPGRLRPIRVRLTLWYVLLLGAVLVLFGGALYLALHITLVGDLDGVLANGTSLLIDSLQVDAQGELLAGPGEPLGWSDPRQGEHLWRVLDRAGRVVARGGGQELGELPADPAVIVQALAGRDLFQTVCVGDEPIRLYTAPVIQGGRVVGAVQQGISMDDTLRILAAFRWTLALALPATLALASGGGLFLAGRALRPVDQITRAAQTIGAHGLSQRLNLDLPDDELGRLASTFDAMIARLDDAFHRQRRFTADASHELRTPLTVIKGDVSLALGRPRDAETYRQILVEVDEEVDHMGRLVDRLLALARADADGLSLQRRWTDLTALLADLVEQARPMAEGKGLDLVAQIAPTLTATVDPDAVTQIVLNLLDNAIKYTPAGRVRLSAHRASPGGKVRISISDGGPGIPAEHLPHIFDRFYRVDRARSRELGGAGLGLAIARELAQAHGGEITVHSVPGEGSTFTVHLPAG
jgi:heavy metal sensor kinase